MEQLYLEFDEMELKKNLELFKRIQDEKNGDIESAIIEFADGYIKGKMDLPVFLQVVNRNIRSYPDINRGIAHIEKLLPAILKVKEYMENNKNPHINIIYKLLICIYNSKYDEENALLASKKIIIH